MTPEADRVVEALLQTGEARGKTPAQVAIAWLLARPGLTSAMIGPDAPAHVDEALGATGWALDDDEIRALDEASAWSTHIGQIT